MYDKLVSPKLRVVDGLCANASCDEGLSISQDRQCVQDYSDALHVLKSMTWVICWLIFFAVNIGSPRCRAAEPDSVPAEIITADCGRLRTSLDRVHGRYTGPGPTADPDSILHGTKQLDLILRDRPAMARYLEKDAKMRVHLAAKFTTIKGQRIFWSNLNPDVRTPQPHANTKFIDSGGAFVFVARSKNGVFLNHDELWSALVFEINNARINLDNWVEINKDAELGRYSRDEYVRKIAGCEHMAIIATQFFYAYEYLPWASSRGIATKADNWWCTKIQPTRDYLATLIDHSTYPWIPYGRQFDRLLAQKDIRDKRFNDALVKYVALLENDGFDENTFSDTMAAAYCYSELSMHDKALVSLQKTKELARSKREKSELSYRIAIEHGFSNDLTAARQFLRDSIKEDPGGPFHALSLQREISLAIAEKDEASSKILLKEYEQYFPKDPHLESMRMIIDASFRPVQK